MTHAIRRSSFSQANTSTATWADLLEKAEAKGAAGAAASEEVEMAEAGAAGAAAGAGKALCLNRRRLHYNASSGRRASYRSLYTPAASKSIQVAAFFQKRLRFSRYGCVFRRHRRNGAANSLVDIHRRGGDDKDEWIPVTKLGRLVKEGRIRSLEEIFHHSMPIKEHQIVDHFFPPTAGKLKDEVMTIKPVQKQSSAGQRTRFKAYVAVGDFDGHIGLGKKQDSVQKSKTAVTPFIFQFAQVL